MSDPAICDGSSECEAALHFHGCYSDDGTNCDHPGEHDWPEGGNPTTSEPVREAERIRGQAHALYLRTAEVLAKDALRTPHIVGGRGSVLEADLAKRVLALLADRDRLVPLPTTAT